MLAALFSEEQGRGPVAFLENWESILPALTLI